MHLAGLQRLLRVPALVPAAVGAIHHTAASDATTAVAPTANTSALFDFFGSFLLQEDCPCRLGLLSCDNFQVVAEQTELALSGNAIGGPGGMAVAQTLQSNTALVRLEMGNCGLSTESLVALATAKTRSTT